MMTKLTYRACYLLLLVAVGCTGCRSDIDWPAILAPAEGLPMPRPQTIEFRPTPLGPEGWWQRLTVRLKPCGTELRLLQRAAGYEPIHLEILQVIHPRHEGYFNSGQLADLFDYTSHRWTYISDPININDIHAVADNWGVFRGDCEDFAVMMSACIHAIGGETRIVYAFSARGAHAYAEVNVGRHIEPVEWYLRARYRLPEEAEIQFTRDEFGQYWLPLDSSWEYPGGPAFAADMAMHFYLRQGHCDIIYNY